MFRSPLFVPSVFLTVLISLAGFFPSTGITQSIPDIRKPAADAPLRFIPQQTGNLRVRERNPVVNEGGAAPIALTATDAANQPVTEGVTWESGSPEIAAVDPRTGSVRGVRQGFATITARRGNDTASVFVAVSRVGSTRGVKIPGGQTEADSGGRIYLSNPNDNMILRKDSFDGEARPFAGRRGQAGRTDGQAAQALFAGPTAVTVDNSPQGGVYVADTLNHSIRKVDFTNQVTTLLGNGSPGQMTGDVTPFEQARLRGPRGIAADSGGNLFVADTENHAIFYVDFVKREVRLLAGEPGTSGRSNGRGRAARFTRPAGLSLSEDGRLLVVADEGNNLVRLVTRDGEVSALGQVSSARGIIPAEVRDFDQASDAFTFDQPQSVGIDPLGNVYVVDRRGVQVVTRAFQQQPQIVALAQTGSFQQAASIVVRGTQSFVLDANAQTDAEAVKVVTVGGPEILELNIDTDTLAGGSELIITGRNFAPETQVTLGDRIIADAVVESATRIRVPRVPGQDAPGQRTLSVQTRGGVAQRSFGIVSKKLADLADGQVTTIAGGVPFTGDGGAALQARFSVPQGVMVDGFGNLVIADSGFNRIRRIDSSGIVTTVAGNGVSGFSGDDVPAISTALNTPKTVIPDRAGNLLVADFFNNRIRRIDAATGIITTIAGTGESGYSGDGGPATRARLSRPQGIAVDAGGNLFVCDTQNHCVRRVDARTGIITTVAGTGAAGFSGDGGPATRATFRLTNGIAVDAQGNLFISDGNNNRIRFVSATDGTISTYAGTGDFGFGGDGGAATEAKLAFPFGLILDGSGNLLIADLENNRIRRIDRTTRVISTVAGTGRADFSGDGGPATDAAVNGPTAVAADGAGNTYIADQNNARIRRIAPDGTISTVAGSALDNGDGKEAVRAILSNPFQVIEDTTGGILVADTFAHRIRKIDPLGGKISTMAGTGRPDRGPDDVAATESGISTPTSIAVDRDNNLYVSDTGNNRIRRVDGRAGTIATIAGTGDFGFAGDGGPAKQARLASPGGIAVDRNGNVFVLDTFNHRIRRIDTRTGTISTIAGTGEAGFSGDGGPATQAQIALSIDNVTGGTFAGTIALDGSGNIFFTDLVNARIRRIDAQTGIITTVAGNGDFIHGGDGGPARDASFAGATGVTVDGSGAVFIADQVSQRIRRIDPRTNVITTIAGDGATGYAGDGGTASTARFNAPVNVAVDGRGNLLIADDLNNAIRIVKNVAVPLGAAVPLTSGTPTGGSVGAPSPGSGLLGDTQYAIQVPAGATLLRIDLIGESTATQLDLFIRLNQPVAILSGQAAADARTSGPTGIKSLTVSPTTTPALRTGTYYVAVGNFGPGEGRYTLVATVNGPNAQRIALTSGTPQGGTIPGPTTGSGGIFGTTQFVVFVPSGTTQLKLDLNGAPINTDIDLFVRYGQPVGLTDQGRIISDADSSGLGGTESITLTATSRPALRPGVYFIAVANFGPGDSRYTVTATVR